MSDRHAPGLDPSGHAERDPQGLPAERARAAYGPVRGYFAANPSRFATLRRWLNQARVGVSYDRYLTTTVRLAIGVALLAGGVGALAGGVATGRANGALVGGSVGALAGSTGTTLWRLLWPWIVARRRARAIDAGLPHAVVFCYALTRGETPLSAVVAELGEAGDLYGPVADEFALVARDMARFDMDLFTAIEHARALTPSDEFAAFCDELVSVLETGGDVGAFVASAADTQFDRAEERQAALLDDLTFLAQAHVVAVLVGPTLLLVVLVVAALVGESTTGSLGLLVYAGIPGVVGLFAVAVARFDRAFRPGGRPDASTDRPALPERGRARARARRYRAREQTSLAERLRTAPVETLRDQPGLAAAAGVPLALVAVTVAVLVGVVPATPTALSSRPVATTLAALAVPFLLIATPYAVFDTLRVRRQHQIRRRLPNALSVLADANENDVPLGESFRLAAGRADDALGRELRQLHRDIQWGATAASALRRFGARLGVPAAARVVRLLSAAVASTGQLARVFRIVADDLRARNRLARERRRRMSEFIVVVAVGVLVFLGIIAAFDLFFLPVVDAVSRRAAETGVEQLGIASVDITVYRRLLLHAALLQAVGNGLLLGRLTDGRFRSGLRYAVPLVATVVVAFVALTLTGTPEFVPTP
ncbi:type II secretion system F family protein [Halosegnis sp.]|uniref:type II secretion system F family protein n=1 Tax=Halosegnis sp. TaxID=2864959 RepID=UPI0035D3EC24